jgi:restriction endonuclease Mrr
LTQLLLTFVEFDNARKARRALLDAMRAEAMTPLRATIPADAENLRAFFDEMHPVEFERHVMSFFADSGHPTGLTPQSNDFGVDGYVFHPEGIIIVQCKRYGEDHPVGRPAIQQFKGVIEEQNALRGYVVTTSRFTQEAQNSASQSERIILIDFVALCDWHRNGFQIS